MTDLRSIATASGFIPGKTGLRYPIVRCDCGGRTRALETRRLNNGTVYRCRICLRCSKITKTTDHPPESQEISA